MQAWRLGLVISSVVQWWTLPRLFRAPTPSLGGRNPACQQHGDQQGRKARQQKHQQQKGQAACEDAGEQEHGSKKLVVASLSLSSQVALFRQRYAALVAHHDVVQGSYPDQVQGLPQLVGEGEIRLAGFRITGRVVADQHGCCGVVLQGSLDDFRG